MNVREQAEKAEQFRKLHRGPRMLVLPNAWDVASARILEEAGYPAIAPTSAGVAFSLGYPDGERISRKEMLEVVARIAHAVRVPVTADMEAGYGTTVKDMIETAKAVVAAGAIGLNLEDVTGDDASSHVDVALQVEKIREVQSDGPRGNHGFRGFDHVFDRCAVAGLHIGGHGHAHRMGDPRHNFQHLLSRDALAVRIPQGKSDSGAGRRNGWIAGLFQDSRAGHVPCVRQH